MKYENKVELTVPVTQKNESVSKDCGITTEYTGALTENHRFGVHDVVHQSKIADEAIEEKRDANLHGDPAQLVKADDEYEDLSRSYLIELKESFERGEIVRLTAKEEIELSARAAKGDIEARNRMIMCNLPLAVSYAMKFVNCGLELADLIEEANLGLIQAVNRFDSSKKCRFSTYAHFWIRKEILKAIGEQKHTIRLPNHVLALERKIRRESVEFEKRFGREPRSDELARLLKKPVEQIEKCLYLSEMLVTCSIDARVANDNDDDAVLGDFVRDEAAKSPIKYAEASSLRWHLHEELRDRLTKQEETAVRMLCGFGRRRPYSICEMSRKMGGVDQAEVKKIVRSAIQKLKHSPKAEITRGFLEL